MPSILRFAGEARTFPGHSSFKFLADTGAGKYFADMHKIRRKQRQARFVLIGVTLAFVISVTSCGFNKIKPYLPFCEVQTDAEIIELADAKLTRFCLQEGIDKKEFTNPPKINFYAKEKLWVIDYESSEDFVRFMVDNCGGIETSSGPSEKVTKVE